MVRQRAPRNIDQVVVARVNLECSSVAGVEDLPLHLVGCDEDLLQARVIEQLRWNKVNRTLPQTLGICFNNELFTSPPPGYKGPTQG